MLSYLTPEGRARVRIDEMLAAAGWVVQDAKQVNVAAFARGCGARLRVEAKKEGATLTMGGWQSAINVGLCLSGGDRPLGGKWVVAVETRVRSSLGAIAGTSRSESNLMEADPLTITTKCADCGAETPVVVEGAQDALSAGQTPFSKTVSYLCSGCGKDEELSVTLG